MHFKGLNSCRDVVIYRVSVCLAIFLLFVLFCINCEYEYAIDNAKGVILFSTSDKYVIYLLVGL